MKKLYLTILIILIPAIVYLSVFFVFDPYGYWGNNVNERNKNTLTAKMLDFRNGNYDAIIIGDSRIANYNPSELSAITGHNYINLAYGGCITEEMDYLLQWCLEIRDVKEIVIITSFYNMNSLLQQNRVYSTNKVIESPLSYAFNIDNAKAMLDNIKHNKPTNSSNNAQISESEKAEHFKISKESMEYYLNNYVYAHNVINSFNETLKTCANNSIDTKIVLPPWWKDFYELLKEKNLLEIIDNYKSTLSEYATIYDFEYQGCLLNNNYDDFSDYSHFSGKTYQNFIKTIIENDTSFCRIWRNKTLQ